MQLVEVVKGYWGQSVTSFKKQVFRLPGVSCLLASIVSECWALTIFWVVK